MLLFRTLALLLVMSYIVSLVYGGVIFLDPAFLVTNCTVTSSDFKSPSTTLSVVNSTGLLMWGENYASLNLLVNGLSGSIYDLFVHGKINTSQVGPSAGLVTLGPDIFFRNGGVEQHQITFLQPPLEFPLAGPIHISLSGPSTTQSVDIIAETLGSDELKLSFADSRKNLGVICYFKKVV